MRRRYVYYLGAKATLVRSFYTNNKRLAVLLEWKDPNNGPAMKVTVNLEDGLELQENYAYLDTNNCPGIDEVLLQSGLAVPTGMYCGSGYCRYPLFKFKLSKIPEVKR